MLTTTSKLMIQARDGGYGLGAFNVYNLEEVRGVIAASEALKSPVILQILPGALEPAGTGLINYCLETAKQSRVPVAVHLDHCSSAAVIKEVLDAGLTSVMADGSHLEYEANVAFSKEAVALADACSGKVEAELGRLTGTEDDWAVEAYESCLTDPDQAQEFVTRTGIGALAVCIGNVHGRYPKAPNLDFQRLADIARRVSIPLVLHGTSGLPEAMIRQAIKLGVCKFNVNTELRQAYLFAAGQYFAVERKPELTGFMRAVTEAVSRPVKQKIELFGSAGRAG